MKKINFYLFIKLSSCKKDYYIIPLIIDNINDSEHTLIVEVYKGIFKLISCLKINTDQV